MVPRQTVYSTPRSLPGQGVHTPRSGPVCETLTTNDTKDHEGLLISRVSFVHLSVLGG